MLFLRFIPVLKRKWHFTKNGHALLAVSDFRHAESRTAGAWLQSPTPCQEPEVLGFPLLYRFSIKGMMLFLRFIPVLKRKWHFTKSWACPLASFRFPPC